MCPCVCVCVWRMFRRGPSVRCLGVPGWHCRAERPKTNKFLLLTFTYLENVSFWNFICPISSCHRPPFYEKAANWEFSIKMAIFFPIFPRLLLSTLLFLFLLWLLMYAYYTRIPIYTYIWIYLLKGFVSMKSEYVSGLMLATFVRVETENIVVTGSCKNVCKNTI